jgi:hypothetical protein
MDILAKLFGSAERVRILRLFLLNPEDVFSLKEVGKRAKVSASRGRREIKLLSQIGFITKKTRFGDLKPKDNNRKVAGKKRARKKKIQGWNLDKNFPFLFPLRKLVLNISPLSKKEILRKICRAGRIKLVILAGIFIHEDNSRVDIMIVGDSIKRRILERSLRAIEAEIGKELNYVVFSTKNFYYRVGIYDKFIRDVLDYPHEKILDKLEI